MEIGGEFAGLKKGFGWKEQAGNEGASQRQSELVTLKGSAKPGADARSRSAEKISTRGWRDNTDPDQILYHLTKGGGKSLKENQNTKIGVSEEETGKVIQKEESNSGKKDASSWQPKETNNPFRQKPSAWNQWIHKQGGLEERRDRRKSYSKDRFSREVDCGRTSSRGKLPTGKPSKIGKM